MGVGAGADGGGQRGQTGRMRKWSRLSGGQQGVMGTGANKLEAHTRREGRPVLGCNSCTRQAAAPVLPSS